MFKATVLDHGFVTLRNLAGPTRRIADTSAQAKLEEYRHFDADDTDVANAARLSFEGQDQDRTYEVEMKLNTYLMKNRHMTPFEVIEVWLEMKLPIFVARQLVRQRTQTLNEASARYIQLPAEWYIPKVVGGKAPNKKQGQEDNLSEEDQAWFRSLLASNCRQSYADYQEAINRGVAMEHARLMLHLNHYTHWMAKMNLRNLMISFLSLRDHGHAQVEAQVYARATISLLEPHLPGLMKLYQDLIKQM
ncbi:putative thymidylate synthase [Xylophilus phage Lumi]|nr:putative thymidylate synthase [Xylophilus phage Lumi]